MLLCVRNATRAELTGEMVAAVVRGIVFLSTRHLWNRDQLDARTGATWDGWRIPETELYEAVHVLRRRLVGWLRAAEQAELDAVLDGVVRCSATSGHLLPTADEVPNLWAYIEGDANRGRFTQFAIRSAEQPLQPPAGDAAKVATVPDGGSLNIVVDVQVMQMTLKASHPQARRLVEKAASTLVGEQRPICLPGPSEGSGRSYATRRAARAARRRAVAPVSVPKLRTLHFSIARRSPSTWRG